MSASKKTPPPAEGRRYSLTAGSFVYREGERGESFFLIRRGQARVRRSYQGKSLLLETLGPGDLFGELSILKEGCRTESVEALSELHIVEIHATFETEDLPVWWMPILRSLLSKFRRIQDRFVSIEAIGAYQRKISRSTPLSRTIYEECRRYIAVFLVLWERTSRFGEPLQVPDLWSRWQDLMGPTWIPFSRFLRTFEECAFMERSEGGSPHGLNVFEPEIEMFRLFLESELTSDRCLILSDAALTALRRIVRLLEKERTDKEMPTGKFQVTLTLEQILSAAVPGGESEKALFEGLLELSEARFLEVGPQGLRNCKDFRFEAEMTERLYRFQVFLKSFSGHPQRGDEDLEDAEKSSQLS